jgi:hypothetical protein
MLRRWNTCPRRELFRWLGLCPAISAIKNTPANAKCSPMYHLAYFSLALAITASTSVAAQTVSPAHSGGMEVGSGGGLAPPITAPLVSGEDAGIRRHLGPSGKACLNVRGQSRSEKINPKLFEHMIVVVNQCSERIKLQVCYYQSHHCMMMDLPSFGRSEAILGIMPAMSGFRFEFREQFNSFESTSQ